MCFHFSDCVVLCLRSRLLRPPFCLIALDMLADRLATENTGPSPRGYVEAGKPTEPLCTPATRSNGTPASLWAFLRAAMALQAGLRPAKHRLSHAGAHCRQLPRALHARQPLWQAAGAADRDALCALIAAAAAACRCRLRVQGAPRRRCPSPSRALHAPLAPTAPCCCRGRAAAIVPARARGTPCGAGVGRAAVGPPLAGRVGANQVGAQVGAFSAAVWRAGGWPRGCLLGAQPPPHAASFALHAARHPASPPCALPPACSVAGSWRWRWPRTTTPPPPPPSAR